MAYLRLNISNMCNFSCKYCHVFKLNDNKMPMKVMDYETIESSIEGFMNVLKKYGGTSLILSIYGGEPLINKHNLFKAVEKYHNNYYGVNINWMVNTNGSLFTEEVADFFKRHDIDVHLSADGFEETHNKNRLDKFGKGTFSRVEKALCLIKQKGIRAQINSFVFPENINNLLELVDLANRFGINRIYLDLFYDTQKRMISSDALSRRYFEVYNYGLKNGVKIFGPWTRFLTRHAGKKLSEHKNEIKAYNNTPSINVTVDKKFFFNCYPTMEPLDLKHLSYDEFVKNHKNAYNQFRMLVENTCGCCFLKERCNGAMISQFQYHTRLDKGWEQTCASTREIIGLIKSQTRRIKMMRYRF